MEVQKKILKFFSLWLPPILWGLLIFRLSSGAVPQASASYWPNFAFMKGAHTFFYGLLSILIYRALLGEKVNRRQAAILSVIITILYGVSDEFHQLFTQGREARLRDIFFDALGGGITVYIIYNFISKIPRRWREVFIKFGLK